MNLDAKELFDDMLTGVQDILHDKGEKAAKYAGQALGELSEGVASVAQLLHDGSIDEARARKHLEALKNAGENVLKSVEGIGLLSAQSILEKALGTVSGVVNHFVGFDLI